VEAARIKSVIVDMVVLRRHDLLNPASAVSLNEHGIVGFNWFCWLKL